MKILVDLFGNEQIFQNEETEQECKSHKIENIDYNKAFDIVKIHRLESYLFWMLKFHLLATIFNLVVLPIQCIYGLSIFISQNLTRYIQS